MSGKAAFPGPLTAFLIGSASVAAVFFWWVLGARFTSQILCMAIALAAGRGLTAWLAALQLEAPRRERLGLGGFAPKLLPALLLLTPAALLVLELQNLLCDLLGYAPLRGALEVRPIVLGLDQADWLPGAVLALVIVTPVASELLFRGFMQSGLVERLGERKGLALASAYAAACHVAVVAFGSVLGLAVFLAVLPWQLLFGWLRLRTGSIWPGVLVRALSSVMLILAFLLAASRPVAGVTADGVHLPLPLLALALVSSVAGLLLLRRQTA